MSCVRAAIVTLGLLAFTAAFADEAPKASKSAEQPVCRSLPIPGSHIKAHVCGAQLDRYLRDRDGLLSLSAPAATTSLPPVTQTTTPMQ